jgi:predicted sugar kinase
MTYLEVVSPSLLHLGFVRGANNALCELGVTLQHPQIQMTLQPADNLQASGARADAALRYAKQFLGQKCLPAQGEIEIEIAIPAHMGLGSDAMLDASLQQVFSQWHNLPGHHRMPLAQRACQKGGLLMTDDDGLMQDRATIAHADDAKDWVFVLALPQLDEDVPDSFEADCTHALQAASVHLKPETTQMMQELWHAVKRDDIANFATALAQIHTANARALASAGTPRTPSAENETVLQLMRDNGALTCAQALTGLGLYALVQGRAASKTLRDALKSHFGYFGPMITATVCDNVGVRIKEIRD